MDKTLYNAYVSILKEELLPAMGCTEPIAVAYAAAVAARELGCTPETVEIVVSGNIIKNVKSVVVPNTGGLRGLAAAAAAGIVAGDPDAALQVISRVTAEDHKRIAEYLKTPTSPSGTPTPDTSSTSTSGSMPVTIPPVAASRATTPTSSALKRMAKSSGMCPTPKRARITPRTVPC